MRLLDILRIELLPDDEDWIISMFIGMSSCMFGIAVGSTLIAVLTALIFWYLYEKYLYHNQPYFR